MERKFNAEKEARKIFVDVIKCMLGLDVPNSDVVIKDNIFQYDIDGETHQLPIQITGKTAQEKRNSIRTSFVVALSFFIIGEAFHPARELLDVTGMAISDSDTLLDVAMRSKIMKELELHGQAGINNLYEKLNVDNNINTAYMFYRGKNVEKL